MNGGRIPTDGGVFQSTRFSYTPFHNLYRLCESDRKIKHHLPGRNVGGMAGGKSKCLLLFVSSKTLKKTGSHSTIGPPSDEEREPLQGKDRHDFKKGLSTIHYVSSTGSTGLS